MREDWEDIDQLSERIGQWDEQTLKMFIRNARQEKQKLKTMLASWTAGARWLRKGRRAGTILPKQAAERLTDEIMAEILAQVRSIREIRGQLMETHEITEQQAEQVLKVIILNVNEMAENRMLPKVKAALEEWDNGAKETKH